MVNLDVDALLSAKSFVVYILVINIITFLCMGLDKWKAKRGAWRIKEGTLFTLVLLGGGVGGIAGMYVFHHKTQKPKFKIGFPTILIIEVIILVYYLITKS